MAKLFQLMVTIFLLVCTAILRGFVFMTLWTWFVVETFQAPKLNLAVAVGLCITISLLTSTITAKKFDVDSEEDVTEALIIVERGFTYPLFILLAGYIITLFM